MNIRVYHEPVEIRVGGQTRHLMLTPDVWRLAQRALSGRDPRFALLEGGLDPVCVVAAFALRHEGKVSDKVVEAWITHSPDDTVPLIDAVHECARRFLVRAGILEEPPASPKDEGTPTTSP